MNFSFIRCYLKKLKYFIKKKTRHLKKPKLILSTTQNE